MADAKKFVFRATYGGPQLAEKKLSIIAVDFTEALKKAQGADVLTGLGTGSNPPAVYELQALRRAELVDVE